MKTTITLRINGESRSFDVASGETLLEMLRERAGVKSPKIGCERGDCGSCTVLLDGRTVRSCLVLAVEADGREVTTVEGLCRDGLTPLQEAFVALNAFQCGYCAPGVLMTATELLARNPDPTEDEVKEAIAGNLCRCTGYEPIVRAIMSVGGREARKRGEKDSG